MLRRDIAHDPMAFSCYCQQCAKVGAKRKKTMEEAPVRLPEAIQKPTIGRVVLFTAFRGHEEKATDQYAGIIVKVHEGGVVDIVTFGPFSVYHNNGVPHDAAGGAQGWRYPEITRDTIEV